MVSPSRQDRRYGQAYLKEGGTFRFRGAPPFLMIHDGVSRFTVMFRCFLMWIVLYYRLRIQIFRYATGTPWSCKSKGKRP